MRAETMKNRPEFKLLKKSDNPKLSHLQLPRWLVDHPKYKEISLEAKFVYTLLLNRFQISQVNGWVNEVDEVFIVYTRKELSQKLNVCEKRVSSAMNELKENSLVWEKRCGRGFANQIYLADVRMLLDNGQNTNVDKSDGNVDNFEGFPQQYPDLSTENDIVAENIDDAIAQAQETPDGHFQNGENGGSKTSGTAVQEAPDMPGNKNNLVILNTNALSQSPSMSCRNEEADLALLRKQAELDYLPEAEARVLWFALERLYFSQSIKVGNAIYPNARIRSHLWSVNSLIIQDALHRIRGNTKKIVSSSAYVVTVLFNTIMEHETDLIVDPYLNFLSGYHDHKNGEQRGG